MLCYRTFGTRHRFSWRARARCMVSCACTGPRKSSSGPPHPRKPSRASGLAYWTSHRTAIYLNDKYSIDGCDPNGEPHACLDKKAGYAGVAWSVMGIHDMGWKERPVFGKIRFMNYAGCKRKFDIKAYAARWQNDDKKRKADFFKPAAKQPKKA